MNDKRGMRRAHLTNIGLNPDDVEIWVSKWNGLGGRNISILTFQEYTQLAVDAGIRSPSEIGKASESYNMSRIGDVGLYEIGNCRFLLKWQNLVERTTNGGMAIGAAKTSLLNKGNCEGRLRGSIALSKSFELISPDGIVHRGSNVTEFCKLRGLNQSEMSSVCRGAIKRYKGWTGKYIEGKI